ncbi:MAG: NfeD family protein [Granulosicoccaceae bacterium]|jgi:membrane protein implicated in regulation of membrane protease activity
MKGIFNHRWLRFFVFAGLGVLVSAAIVYVLVVFYDVDALELVLIAVTVNLISDFVFAWRNERAIQQGKVKLHNDMSGKEATVIETFVRKESGFRGKVFIGGERWAASSSVELAEGEIVRIRSREGLVLSVERQA